MKRIYGIALLAIAAAVAHADLYSRGAFTGAYSDDFESYQYYPDVNSSLDTLTVMGGAATFSSTPAATKQLWIYNTGANGWAWSDGSSTGTHSGAQGLGLAIPPSYADPVNVTLTFSVEVHDFGGYFASDNKGDPLNIAFYDATNTQIGATQYITGQDLTWAGWSSDAKIAYLQFGGNFGPVMDDIQAAVPEPASMVALALGCAAFVARRRKR